MCRDISKEVAMLLSKGKIVGWHKVGLNGDRELWAHEASSPIQDERKCKISLTKRSNTANNLDLLLRQY